MENKHSITGRIDRPPIVIILARSALHVYLPLRFAIQGVPYISACDAFVFSFARCPVLTFCRKEAARLRRLKFLMKLVQRCEAAFRVSNLSLNHL